MGDRLGDRLATAREQGFVGRRQETDAFRALLRARDGAVVYVHGAGGIGKTALLHHFARLGLRAGRPVLQLDARELRPYGEEAAAALPRESGALLLLDSVEELVADASAPHRGLLPKLPADALVALAARDAPPLPWRLDPARQGLLHTMPLAPLDAADSGELLRRRGVPEHVRAAAFAFTRGIPLALALVADLAAQGAAEPCPAGSPEAVPALLAGLLDAAPTAPHRAALEAAAQVAVITEPLLAAVLEAADARSCFEWLRGLSAMEYGPRGIRPHDLVRDALDAELHRRHPERRQALRRRAGAYYQRAFTHGDRTRQRSVLADFAYLHRESPVVGPLLSPLTGGAAEPTRLDRLTVVRAGEGELVQACTIAAIHEGAPSARLVRAWAEHPACETYTVCGPDGVAAGFYTLLELAAEPLPAAPSDPAVTAARRWLGRRPRGDGTALLVRFWMGRDDYQDVSPVQTLIMLRLSRHYLTGHRSAVTLLPCADPEFWEPGCAYADFARLPAADFRCGGRTYGMFAHDWRRTPPLAWLELLAERGRSEDPAAGAAPRVLERDEFADAVRDALRGLARPDGLRDSPLLDTRLVAARCGEDADGPLREAALREAFGEAAAVLESSAADRRAFRALHHTYVRPAGSPARAAELLGLPMAAYRRHLAAGVGRLTELLWRQELDAAER
ncbi:ATP-binding protein [Streptomyces sp. NPDC050610]|uniref:ATP-binding protein n=1 Tax=Streptomyces sp. NPDC050610 TaxID=3157097 RepID=UPI00343BA9E7